MNPEVPRGGPAGILASVYTAPLIRATTRRAAMIARYTRPEMGALWTDEARMEAWRRVEVAACEAMDGPSEDELDAIRRATFTVEAVNERERTTDHDLAAFVDMLSASAGDAGRWIHFGLTSSDVLDTATGVQLQAAGEIVLAGARSLVDALSERAREHVDTVCVGRTHGVHAEPTTFGIKLAGFAMEASRNVVATGAGLRPGVGRRDLGRRRHVRRDVAGVRGARARRASAWSASRSRRRSSPATATPSCCRRSRSPPPGLERLATEIRHLQRTEVREVEEPFRAGQKGSSAMPHKRNPITTERITGLARVLRGNASAAVENVALWHERDISHSGAERVILPDSTDPARLPAAPRDPRRARDGRARGPDALEPRRHVRRAVLPAGAARARDRRDDARRGLPRDAGARAARVGHAHAAARAAGGAAGAGPGPRRDLRSGALHAVRGRRSSGGCRTHEDDQPVRRRRDRAARTPDAAAPQASNSSSTPSAR